jgi:hypothetical protein
VRHLLALISVLSVCCLTLPLAQGAPASYTVQPTPDFAFIGDSVTFQVSGIPLTYVFLIVHPAGQYNGSALADRFQQLDYQGLASVNVTIPADAESGEYVASVMVDGAEVANCSLSVLFDYETWSKMMITEMTGEIEAERNQTRMLRQELASLRGENQQMLMVAYLTIGFAGFTCVYVWVNKKDWRDWNWSAIRRAKGFEDQIKMSWYMIRNPPPEGEMTMLHDGMRSKMEAMRRKLAADGKPVQHARVIIPPADPSQEARVFNLETVDLEPVEAPAPLPAPAPVPEKAPEKVREPRRPLFARRAEPRPEKPKRTWRTPAPAVPEKGRFNVFKSQEELKMEEPEPEAIVPELEIEEEKPVPKEEPKPEPKVEVTPKPKAPRKKSSTSAKKRTTKPKAEKPAEGSP